MSHPDVAVFGFLLGIDLRTYGHFINRPSAPKSSIDPFAMTSLDTSISQHLDLSHLAPIPLKPCGCRSHALVAMDFTQQIEFIELSSAQFSPRRNKFLYEMDVFLFHEPNRIPCNQNRSNCNCVSTSNNLCCCLPEDPAQEPDLRVRRSFSQFVALRDELLELCQCCPYGCCDHCNDLFRFLLFSAKQPSALTKLITSNNSKPMVHARQRILAAFMNRLVQLAQAAMPSASAVRSCQQHFHLRCVAGERLPMLLHAFLHPE